MASWNVRGAAWHVIKGYFGSFLVSVFSITAASKNFILCINRVLVVTEMLLQFATVVLVLVQTIAAHENPEVPVVVVSQHQLRKDIRKEVTSVIAQATANITDTIGDEITQEINSALEDAITNVTDAIEQFLKPLLDELALQRLPGKTPSNPAASCEEVKVGSPSTPSGYYWIQNSDIPLVQVYCKMNEVLLHVGERPSSPASSCKEIKVLKPKIASGYYWIKSSNESVIRVYCDMTRTCGGITGGWMQVANIDMTNSSHTCPQGLKTLTSPKRLCGITISGPGCSSATFAAHGLEYSHVCGKMIGYQYGGTDAFYAYSRNRGYTIDNHYVTGVSLTHGRDPRKHIWTLAAGVSEIHRNTGSCPCSHAYSAYAIPPWVGEDYFCDTGLAVWRSQNSLFTDDPLWDGEGCESPSTCCSFNNPPWFSKRLPSPTTDDIEMRLCGSTSRTTQDVPVEKIELYVQ